MPPIGMLGARRRLLWVALVALSVLSSCGGADKFELTLRARDDDGTSYINLERPWVAADGRGATSPPTSGRFQLNPNPDIGEAECGGQKWPRHFFEVLGPEQMTEGYTFELKIDDGNRLTLDPQTGVVVAFYYGGTDCFEETGRWRGTDGDLRDHEGTFTIHYDTIQTVLRLVED